MRVSGAFDSNNQMNSITSHASGFDASNANLLKPKGVEIIPQSSNVNIQEEERQNSPPM